MRILASLVLSPLPFLLSVAGAEAKDRQLPDMLELQDDFIIPVKLNGRAYRLEVEPDGGAARVVNPDVAKTLSLKPSMIGGLHNVGPVRLTAASDSVEIDYGQAKRKDRMFWFDRQASTIADGAINPTMLPFKQVRFILSPRAEGEREYTMPLEGAGMFGIGGGYGKYAYGEIDLQISFNLNRSDALMTAPVGVEVAAGQGGHFLDEPRQAVIRFGVERPVRLMIVDRPLLIFGRPLSSALVRVNDFGDASTIPGTVSEDQDEIVVTGKAKKKPRYSLTLGRDFLNGCSSLTYDLAAKIIRISCKP